MSRDELMTLVKQYETQVEKQSTEIEDLEAKITRLNQTVALLQHRLYCKKSEKDPLLHHKGDTLFGPIEDLPQNPEPEQNKEEESSSKSPKGKKKRTKKPFPSGIDVEIIRQTIPKDELVCPYDGHQMKRIRWEVTEKLEVIPAEIKVVRIEREVVTCPEGHLRIAGTVDEILPKISVTHSTLAKIWVDKYCDAIPLYRQEEILKRRQIFISRSNMARWVKGSAEKCEPLYEAIRQAILSQEVIYADETPMQVLSEPGREAHKKSYMWVLGHKSELFKAAFFQYDASRSRKTFDKIAGEFDGYVHCDAYNAYKSFAKSNGTTCVGCWAHARRKFVEAHKVVGKSSKSHALFAKKKINELFKIDKDLQNLPPDEKLRKRQELCQPIFDELIKWAQELSPRLPDNMLSRAVHYLLNNFVELSRFLEHPDLELSNNFAERIIKQFVIGRKNWMFSATPSGAKASSIAYTLLQTAKLNGIEPHSYIKDVFDQISRGQQDMTPLLPWNWQPPE